jgi:hypothetical protein
MDKWIKNKGYKRLLYCNYCGSDDHLEDKCKKKKYDDLKKEADNKKLKKE